MDQISFARIVDAALLSFMKSHEFKKVDSSSSGRLYQVKFLSSRHRVDITFEPGDDFCAVYVFSISPSGAVSNIDDRIMTPRLTDLNERYARKVNSTIRLQLENELAQVQAQDDQEKMLLKSLKELRLVLPQFLTEQAQGK